jgi:glycosyltransferase involved in cell wall biosynthesis
MLRHWGQPGGIGVYTANILRALFEIEQKNQYVLMYQRQEQLGQFSVPNVTEQVIQGSSKLWWDQIAVPRFAKKEGLDLIYNPKLSVPLFSPCRTVLVMHGAEQFAVPDSFIWHDRIYFTIANRLYCKGASAVITMTNIGAKDISRYMGADPDKIHVIYESYNESCRVVEEDDALEVRRKYALPEKFILFLGGLNPLKNFRNLLVAYEKLYRELPHKLVVVGFKRWKFSEELEMIDRLGLREHVVFTDFIPDDDIPAIYNLADLFVFPSLYEGFGMPVLEAMACACPVITTKTGSSPEVAGGAAVLIDPYSPDEIAAAIRTVDSDEELREELVAKGLKRAKDFSWKECAWNTLALFESLNGGG